MSAVGACEARGATDAGQMVRATGCTERLAPEAGGKGLKSLAGERLYEGNGCGGEFIRTNTWSHERKMKIRNVARMMFQNSRRELNPARTL